MSTSVDAEQAWSALQRIRIPQERVYDEMERTASGGPGAAIATGAAMWLFLASLGLGLPQWGVGLLLVAYVAVLAALAVSYGRRNRMRLHRSRYDWRTSVMLLAGAAATGGTAVLSGHLTGRLEPMSGSLIQATVTTGVFLLFICPASRWAAGSLRGRAGRTAAREGAGR
ncbi:hypothetical protein GCM10009801_10530 [Streptomyces albiaxialis]|uniref:Integral membrane protein n=1 Tax=Streptomyces albiaxialis TaxID=329523 RepID=A0ABN2VLA7_9ACTN